MKSHIVPTHVRLDDRSHSPARSRRIRTAARFDARSASGGGEIQHLATTGALASLGLDARAWRPWDDELEPGDVLHLFGSRPEFLPLVESAGRRGAKVALSTIAWFDWRNPWREPGRFTSRAFAAMRYAMRAARPRTPSWRRDLYQAADLLLPNSQAEAEQLMRLFEAPASKIRVVPNGIDPRFAAATPDMFVREYGVSHFVLCPGRIEPRKNQLALIRALSASETTLVIAGDVVAGHEGYASECQRAAGPNVRFLPRFEHDDPRLASAYAAAACVALVGWYETPGLAALEAAATGTPVVVPCGGSAREYFGECAEYVRPHDLAGIRAAVDRAIAFGRRPELAELVVQNFTWRHAAQATRGAYDDCL
jgi:glycosyltransferase involved in cell wall biosynthesis